MRKSKFYCHNPKVLILCSIAIEFPSVSAAQLDEIYFPKTDDDGAHNVLEAGNITDVSSTIQLYHDYGGKLKPNRNKNSSIH
ncbi:MAG: hypothetical protein QXH24_03945 [Candidatus Bathyarchaeia archaeon]